MPGNRLTFDERREVAAGLAAGLPCAEIARRMGRPKSTILREVARNGGVYGYRADRAQQATRWRARRRKPVPSQPDGRSSAEPGSAAGTGEERDRAESTRRDFEDRFAGMMTETGVPAMAARVLAFLFTSETGTSTAAGLVAGLEVSPASVSQSVGWLEERGLVRRERDGRRQRYVLDEHVWYQAWQTSVRSMARWADLTREGAELFGGGTPSGARLHATSRFFQHLGRDMAQAAEHWRRSVADGS
jgi:predicted transcriptional regulator